MTLIVDFVHSKKVIYFLLLFFLFAVTIIRFFSIDVGFGTAWDEAYFLIKLREAYEGTFITGKSQWNLIAIHWFPFLDLTDPIHSRVALYLCELYGTIIATLTCVFVYGKKDYLKYFTLSYLFFLQLDTFFAGNSINYITMQALLLDSALCGVLIYKHSNNKIRWSWMLFTGIFLGMALFVILPSSILLIGIVFFMLIMLNDWKSILALILGISVSIFYMDLFICDLSTILDAMKFTATYISKSGYNYSPKDIIIQYGLLMRDGLLCLFVCSGIYFLSKFIFCLHTRIWHYAFILTSVLMYLHYQSNPKTTISLVILCVVIIFFLDSLALSFSTINSNTIVKVNIKREYIFFLFFTCFPLIASVGTNTYVGDRMIYFAISWMLLAFECKNMGLNNEYLNGFIFSIICSILLLGCTSYTIEVFLKSDKQYRFTKGNVAFSQIYITKDQFNYLNKVYDAICEYGFKADSSVVFATEDDWATVYAIDAKLSSNFHQQRNFLYFPKDEMLCPDFIFLSKWDMVEIGEQLKEMPWGWPVKFDSVFVGSPEGTDRTWTDDRWLYCRKIQ